MKALMAAAFLINGLVVAVYAGPAAAATTMKVWTQSVAHKVQPTTAPTTQASIALEGGRRSVEAYQIIVHASGGALTGVNMTPSDLSDGQGHTINHTAISFFREAFIDFTGVKVTGGNKPVPASSPTHDGRIPDPLIPFFDPYSSTAKHVGAPFSVGAGLNQPVWMDVAIPANAAAGVYQGKVTVTAVGQPSVEAPVSLTVWNLTLPDMRTVTTHFTMSEDVFINFHRGIYQCSGNSCWLDGSPYAQKLVKRYEEMAHQHRIDTAASFVPDRGTDCSPPNASYWSSYDARLAPYMNGSYWSDKVPTGRVETPFSPGVSWGLEATCTQAQYTALAKAYAGHLKNKGWFNQAVVYAADEPDAGGYPAIAKNSNWMQAGDKAWKSHIMDTTTPRKSNAALLSPALGIFAVCLACYDNWWDQSSDHPYGRADWPSLFAQGISLWFYESNAQAAPYPTYATNTLLGMEPQMMKWGAWYEKATGFLMWDVSDWNLKNPWGPNTTYGKTGDGVLLYPGNHDGVKKPAGSPANVAIDGPIASYRLKMIRAGLQDWALFSLAVQKGLLNYTRAQVGRGYSQLGGCTWSGCQPLNGKYFWQTSDALLVSIRHNVAMKIVATP